MSKTVYLLTGRPGVGKTTLIKELLRSAEIDAGGFYTQEIRADGTRKGFEIVTLDGQTAILASVDIFSPYRVSKYGVDIDSLENVGVRALRQAITEKALIVIDEIGKMELFSTAFQEAVMEVVKSGKPVLGTVMLGPKPWVDALKIDPRVEVIHLTESNRSAVRERLLTWLNSISKKHGTEIRS